MHDKVKDTSDQWKKPHVHVIYDHIKSGIDIVDLLSTNHSTRITSKRWPVNALAFALDTCRSNAKTILGDNNIKVPNFEFTFNKHSTTIWKSKWPSDQSPQENETCFEYPRMKPPPTIENQRKKWMLFQMCRWNCWYCWLQKQTRETEQQSQIEMSPMQPIFHVKFIINQPNMYVKIALLQTNKHLLVIYTIIFNAL